MSCASAWHVANVQGFAAPILHHPVLEDMQPCAGFGAAYGTAKSGVGIASMGVMRPELVMKSIVPVVMAGVLGIYGLIIAVIISTGSASSLHPADVESMGMDLAIGWH